jgi:ProP effector
MSNASLKEQLQAMASQLSDTIVKTAPEKPTHRPAARQKPGAGRPRPSSPAKPARAQQPRPPAPPKPKWLELAQYGVALLRSYFPAAFKPMSQVQPLKKGIKEDLVKRLSTLEGVVTDDKACMVKSLSFYVNTAAYHRSVVAGVNRLDLDGQPAGQVTPEEALYSAEKLQHKKAGASSPTAKPVTSTSSPASDEASASTEEKT